MDCKAPLPRLPQGHSVHELEDDDVLLVPANELVDPADVGVVELGEDLCLAQEALACGAVQAPNGADDLERHLSLEHLVVAEEDLTHAPFP